MKIWISYIKAFYRKINFTLGYTVSNSIITRTINKEKLYLNKYLVFKGTRKYLII
jgi:hypothetical protein